ncbi:MAG: hypothetical protein ACLP6E_06215 [Acidimicrobiales bacterium]
MAADNSTAVSGDGTLTGSRSGENRSSIGGRRPTSVSVSGEFDVDPAPTGVLAIFPRPAQQGGWKK